MRFERSNVLRPAVAQALTGANSTVVYATGAVVGDMLAPSKALATLPISIFVVGMAACTLPAGARFQAFSDPSGSLMPARASHTRMTKASSLPPSPCAAAARNSWCAAAASGSGNVSARA